MRNKALFLLTVFCFICSCCFCANVELCKPDKSLRDLRQEIDTTSITKADITILGLYVSHNDCNFFKPYYQNTVLNLENPVSIKMDASAKIDDSNEVGYGNSSCFSLSLSFDFILNKPEKLSKGTYYSKTIFGCYSNAKNTLQYHSYSFKDTNNIKFERVEKQDIGLSKSTPKNYVGINAICDSKLKENDFPIVLKPYAQNLLTFKSVAFVDTKPDSWGNVSNKFSVVGERYVDGKKHPSNDLSTNFKYEIFAVLNSLTYEDGRVQVFNQTSINESEWLAQRKDTMPKIPWQGEGTETNPFLIKSAADLLALTDGEDFIGGNYYFKQTNDILDLNKSLNLESWGAQKDNTYLAHYYALIFSGHYDGNGKTISGLVMKKPSQKAKTIPETRYEEYNYGLFRMCRNAEIKNLTLCYDIDMKESRNVGGLTGKAECATFSNIIVKGNISGDKTLYVAGLVGIGDNLSFNNISSSVNAKGGNYTAGVIGSGEMVSLNNINIDSSDLNGDTVGGIAGFLKNSNLRNLKVSAKIIGMHCGGVAGSFSKNCSVNNAVIYGNFSSPQYGNVGGFCGDISGNENNNDAPDRYENIVSYADVSAYEAGGILGKVEHNVLLYNCVNKGCVKGDNAGGIASDFGEGCYYSEGDERFIPTKMELCANYGSVESVRNGGGIAASINKTARICDCCNYAPVSSKERCGGFSAFCNGHIKNCFSTGDLKTDKNEDFIAGFVQEGDEFCQIENSFITGDTKFSDKEKKNYVSEKLLGKVKDINKNNKNSYFASVNDIKLDSTWNPDVWEIVPGKYPQLKGLPTDGGQKEANNSPAAPQQPVTETPAPQQALPEAQTPVIVPQMLDLEP